jgi:citrate/tricarballylate utilization protein
MHATDALREADRQMTICNACRYCEGLCAVFPAMELRHSFATADLNYLANLCHSCGACFYDCQFASPHEYAVDVPRTLAAVRNDSYAAYAWPPALSGLFARNGLAISLIAALSVAAFVLGFLAWHDPAVIFATHVGPGAFYRLMPHEAMVGIFGAAFLYAILAMAMGLRAFWRDTAPSGGTSAGIAAIRRAVRDAGSLRYLDGGGMGCMNEDERPSDRRRLFHHLTFYGFLLCFAATSAASLYHQFLAREAPYPWWDLPVVLGTLGGIGLLIGPAGLLAAKWKRDPALVDGSRLGMDVAFLAMLFLTSLTGLLLLVLRATPAMGVVLALHLGVVFALILTMPYGKFVHGLYRFAALVRYAEEETGRSRAGCR